MGRGIIANIHEAEAEHLRCEDVSQDRARSGGVPVVRAVPAHEGGDDDTPGRAAAVSIEVLLALAVPAAQPEGVEQQEEQVQSQAGQSNATQQQQGLRGTEILSHLAASGPGFARHTLKTTRFAALALF